ncbi:hypothetical protein KKF34_09865 [Myxococcota bacterium]|nr:hypothetical protein [Myxococcota bacterium]MBU1380338.1 hypothetical protein [Myxococcota bacterium]MBU1497171.1 hypothetical protein [Myxococcota bacterium]
MRYIIFFSFFIAISCTENNVSESNNSNTNNNNINTTVLEKIDAFALEVCSQLSDCCSDAFITADCIAEVTDLYTNGGNPATIRPEEMTACIDLQSIPENCDASFMMATPVTDYHCRSVFSGSVAPGEICTTPSDCGDDEYCPFYRGMPICAPRFGAGALCTQDSDDVCVSGYVCLEMKADNTEHVCVRPFAHGDNCESDHQCGIAIAKGFCHEGTCAPLSPPDGWCASNWQCITGECDTTSNTCSSTPLTQMCE